MAGRAACSPPRARRLATRERSSMARREQRLALRRLRERRSHQDSHLRRIGGCCACALLSARAAHHLILLHTRHLRSQHRGRLKLHGSRSACWARRCSGDQALRSTPESRCAKLIRSTVLPFQPPRSRAPLVARGGAESTIPHRPQRAVCHALDRPWISPVACTTPNRCRIASRPITRDHPRSTPRSVERLAADTRGDRADGVSDRAEE